MTKLDLDLLPTSEAAQRMLERVSPVYKGPVVKSLFTVMGLEWDEARTLFAQLPLQAFPETATWGLQYWEQIFQIQPAASETPEQRRQMVLLRRDARAPMNPARVAAIVSGLCGRGVDVVENRAPYTFAVCIRDNDTTLDYKSIRAMLQRIKPSHQLFQLTDQFPTTVLQNREKLFLRKISYFFRITNSPDGEVILLDGSRRLNGSWLFNQAFWGPDLAQVGFSFGLSEQERACVCASSGITVQNREKAVITTVSAIGTAKNKEQAAPRRVSWCFSAQEKYEISGTLTRNSIWRLDDSEGLDGGRRLDAEITEEDI